MNITVPATEAFVALGVMSTAATFETGRASGSKMALMRSRVREAAALVAGERHGVDMTMADAYRWSKEVRPVNLREEEYVQMSEVFDIFVFDFAEAGVEQQVEEMEIIISRDGVVSALVLWFDLILDEEIVVSTSPFGDPDRTLALGQGLAYLQPSECRVKRGVTTLRPPPGGAAPVKSIVSVMSFQNNLSRS